MSSMNISLPDDLRAFVEDRTEEKGYRDVSDYFSELILRDQKHQGERRLEALLLEGVNSGNSIEVTPEYIGAKLQQLVEEYRTRKSQ